MSQSNTAPSTLENRAGEAAQAERMGKGDLFAGFHCRALATDYDGTIATHGTVGESTRAELRRFRATGRRLILVTGRRMADLATVYAHFTDFDVIVAENGAVLYWPETKEEQPLAEPPPHEFIQLLVQADVRPIERGAVIVATFEPYDHAVLNAIKTLGLELQVIFSKGAVMILPTGINKATGLKQALKALGIPPEEVAAVGDAENDHALLDFCGLSAAVDNALPALKEHAKCVLSVGHGQGVEELIHRLLSADGADTK